MAEPTGELIFSTLLSLREDIATFRAEIGQRMDRVEGRMDQLEARFDILTVRMDKGFADLNVAVRAAGNLALAADRTSEATNARLTALEQRVAQLERQH